MMYGSLPPPIGRPIHPPADEPFTFGSSGGALVSPPLPLLPNRQISSAVRIETAAERRWRLTSNLLFVTGLLMMAVGTALAVGAVTLVSSARQHSPSTTTTAASSPLAPPEEDRSEQHKQHKKALVLDPRRRPPLLHQEAGGEAGAAGAAGPPEWSSSWRASRCPLPKEELLRQHAWPLLHSMAAHYPDQPSAQQQELMVSLIEALAAFYPGDSEFRENLLTLPPRVGSRAALSQWWCEQHNLANQRLGKPSTFDCSMAQLDMHYLTGDPRCWGQTSTSSGNEP